MAIPDAVDPVHRWRQDAARHGLDVQLRLRLAAMAGHMSTDRVAARRGALIDLLADGRPHPGEDIRQHITQEMVNDCWGKRPGETLLRDLKVLRRGGIRIAYSRRPGLEGYYLQHPPLAGLPNPARFQSSDPAWTERLRAMPIEEKLATAFAAADFALKQKRLIMREERPEWPEEQVEREARRLVFGVSR
jgi:hypothetical protein